MSSNWHLEEVAKQALKEKSQALKAKSELEAQAWYLQTQIDILMKEKRRTVRSSRRPMEQIHSVCSTHKDYSPRQPRRERRHPSHFNDFEVWMPEFNGESDLKDFLPWMHTIEWIFDYKKIPDEEKVKLVSHKLSKYALSWWTNLLTKRVRQGKKKIRTWEKMRAKLEAHFLPPPTVHTPAQRTHPRPDEMRRCSRCQGLGHDASECPNERSVTLTEYQASFVEFEKEKEEGGKEVCSTEPIEEVEEGNLKIEEIALIGFQRVEKEHQEESLFSDENTMILPIPLPPIQPSQTSYYLEGVVSDDLPMDASRLLLGRSWYFVKGAPNIERSKAYPFKLEDHNYSLIPLRPIVTIWDPGISVENF